jgi:hypothetical protein
MPHPHCKNWYVFWDVDFREVRKSLIYNYLEKCSGRDLNPHALRHTPLKRTCLPFHHPSFLKRAKSLSGNVGSASALRTKSQKFSTGISGSRLSSLRMRCLAFLAVILGLTFSGVAELPLPKSCGQAVCVTTPGWNSPTGVLQRWERTGSDAPWLKIGKPVNVIVGEHGLGWGLGLHGTPSDAGPRKTEGDRRAPAGVFRLVGAFGFAPRAVGKLPWQPVTPTLEAVDDPKSRFYNRIVDRKHIEQPDWRSSERMAAIPGYALGIVVAHNPRNVPGAGSCIFMHLWRGARSGTAGCTALREPDLLILARWLDPVREPVLVQLPRAIAEREWPGL